jgi:hypothetical protein
MTKDRNVTGNGGFAIAGDAEATDRPCLAFDESASRRAAPLAVGRRPRDQQPLRRPSCSRRFD